MYVLLAWLIAAGDVGLLASSVLHVGQEGDAELDPAESVAGTISAKGLVLPASVLGGLHPARRVRTGETTRCT